MKNVTLKCVGFFRELEHGDINGPSLMLQCEQSTNQQPQVIDYLAHGVPYITSPGVVFDAIDQSGPVGTGSILTDGEWAWPDDLIYYLEKYHVVLPEDFIIHVMSNGYSVPEITRKQLLFLHLP